MKLNIKHAVIIIATILLFALIIVFFQSRQISKLETRVDVITHNLDKSGCKSNLAAHDKKTIKTAYLTFDDGPSSITDSVLDILKAKNVKATFFVTYHNNKDAFRVLRRMVNEGHVIGLHSYTHRYSEIYSSVDAFMTDITKLRNYIVSKTGYMPKMLRFPGGSNCPKLSRKVFYGIKSKLNKCGYYYFDWNVSSADTSASLRDVSDFVDICCKGARKHSNAIILMHDNSKKKMLLVDALPIIIDRLRSDGFVFSVLSYKTPQIAFRK